jgi:hypothetical protein
MKQTKIKFDTPNFTFAPISKMVSPPLASKLESMTMDQIEAVVRIAVPNIADHIIQKVHTNEGIPTNPRAVQPVTKLLTLSLDAETSEASNEALVACGDAKARQKIAFITACMKTLDYDVYMTIMTSICPYEHGFEQVYKNNFESVWLIFVDDYRDGALFLETVANGLDDPDDETAEIFLSYYDL